jgi:predicted transcriptional regulator
MPSKNGSALSRREREIMDVLFRVREATVAEVLDELSSPPSYSAVRATLRILEEKGHVRHRKAGLRYVYSPAVSAERARDEALLHVVRTFFGGSAQATAVALMRMSEDELSEDAVSRMSERIRRARREGR